MTMGQSGFPVIFSQVPLIPGKLQDFQPEGEECGLTAAPPHKPALVQSSGTPQCTAEASPVSVVPPTCLFGHSLIEMSKGLWGRSL